MLRSSASVLLTSLSLGACSGSAIQLPGTTKLLDELPKVQNSTKSPCWQQKQVAAQNSYIATVKDGKETVYKAPCEVDQPKGTPAKVASK